MFHPAALLLAWGSLLLLLQRLSLPILMPVTLLAMAAASVLARPLFLSLLRRTRWLFLTLIVMFVAMTPGVLVAAPWNMHFITQEGLLAAGEHVLRLAAMLALLGLLLDRLEQGEIVAALFALLRPFAVIGLDRERVSVRLLLVLDEVAAGRHDRRNLLRLPPPVFAGDTVGLPCFSWRSRDIALSGLAILLVLTGWWRG